MFARDVLGATRVNLPVMAIDPSRSIFSSRSDEKFPSTSAFVNGEPFTVLSVNDVGIPILY
jgi:hypothetical protein